jgi:hypothetical protein
MTGQRDRFSRRIGAGDTLLPSEAHLLLDWLLNAATT